MNCPPCSSVRISTEKSSGRSRKYGSKALAASERIIARCAPRTSGRCGNVAFTRFAPSAVIRSIAVVTAWATCGCSESKNQLRGTPIFRPRISLAQLGRVIRHRAWNCSIHRDHPPRPSLPTQPRFPLLCGRVGRCDPSTTTAASPPRG